MADIVDVTAEREPHNMKLALLRSKRQEGPVATGWCLNCDTELEDDGRRWCDAECRDQWEKDQTQRSMQ